MTEEEVTKALENMITYINSLYETGLNDAWEYVKEICALTPDERKEIFSFSSIFLIVNRLTPMEVINKIEQYEDNNDCVTRHSIIKTKLDEIKGMFEDPVTNEELIEILEEEGDTDETSI